MTLENTPITEESLREKVKGMGTIEKKIELENAANEILVDSYLQDIMDIYLHGRRKQEVYPIHFRQI